MIILEWREKKLFESWIYFSFLSFDIYITINIYFEIELRINIVVDR